MPENNSNQTAAKVIVFVGGKLKDQDAKFLHDFLEMLFKVNPKLNSLIQAFKKIKAIDKPTPGNLLEFNLKVFEEIGAEYDEITSDAVLTEILSQCENFADFVILRPDSFKIKLLEYLST